MENANRFRGIARSGYSRFRRRRFAESVALGLSVLLPGLLLAVGIGIALRFRPESAWIGPIVALGAVGAALYVALRYGLHHRLTYEQYLRRVESLVGLGGNELVNADELEARLSAMDDPLSRGLAAQAVDAGIARVRQVPFEKLAPAMKLTGPAWRGLGAVAAGVLLFVIAPAAFQSGLDRLLHPGTFEIPPAIRILVEPGNVVLQRGEPLDVSAVVPGSAEGARLHFRSEGGPWRSLEMQESAAGSEGQTFAATLRGLLEDGEYAVGTDEARSETFRIEVTEPLRALGYRKNIAPPAYTGIPPSQELSADGNVSAIFGSELRVGVQTGREDTEGELVWEDGTTTVLRKVDDVLYAELRVDEELGYRVRLGSAALEGKEWLSRPFRIVPVPDRMPTLHQLAPETTVQLPPEMVIDIDADCVDDFGLTRLDLIYRRNDRPAERVRLATWSGEREARVVHPWDLEGIALVPGDVISYHLELTDNDMISGPKTVRGPNCEVRFPSLEDLYAEVQEDRGDQMGNLSDLRETQEEIREELDRALTDLKSSDKLGWEQQEALKELAKKQEGVEKKLEDLAESLDKSLQKMEQGDIFSPEMQQKVAEINELAKQIQDPAFRQQMEDLKKALEKLDKNAVEQSLEQMQLSQQDLAQSLDRTLELLKRMKNEESLDQIVQESKRLLEEQRKLNEQLAANLEPQPRGEEPRDPNEEPGADKAEAADAEADDEESDEAKFGEEQEAGDEESDQAKSGEESEAGDEESDQAKSGEESEAGEEESDQAKSGEESEAGEEESDQAKSGEEQQSSDEQQSGNPESGDAMSEEERAELQKKQEELREQLAELEEKLAELQEEAEKSWSELDEQMKQESEPKEKLDSAQQNMDQSAQQMPSSPSQSMKFGRQAEQDLEQFAMQMEQAQQAVAQQEQEDITRQLFHISGQLVTVSQGQEGLLGVAPSQPTRDLAAHQARISQSARQTLDDLNELGRKSRLLSPDLTRAMNGAVRALESSTRAFERGNRQGAMAEGKASTNTLNETVIELLEANDQMCNNPSSGSCNNPMSKMRSLSAQQQELNGDAQSSQGGQQQGGGDRLKPQGGQGGAQSLEQLAARQEMIRRGLAELEGGLGDRKDVLGRLDELADEMGDVVEEMREKGEIDARILERQEKILSRLLTAQKSIRREDEKEQRVSRTGETPYDRETPPPVAEELSRKELLRRGILRGSQDPIPDEFRTMVEDYYQSLSQE